jgi:AcrR family transcriptional regulator
MAKRRKTSNLAAARARMYRDLILESAERVFADHGFEKAAMQDIAAEAGISLKTLYATFRGKEEIYREIGRQRAREFLEHASRSVLGEGSLMERLARGVRAYVDFLLTHRNYFRIQLREGRGWGLDPPDESRSEWRSGVEVQASLLRAGIAEGVFHEGDPELMAATAIAIMQVQLAGLVERSKGEPDAEAITKEIVLALARYLCKPDGFAEARRAVGG